MKLRCPHCHNIIDPNTDVAIDENVGPIGAAHPETSHMMNEKRLGRMGTIRRACYMLCLLKGDEGLTADEFDIALGGDCHSTASSTVNGLKNDGWFKVKLDEHNNRVRRWTRWNNWADVHIIARFEEPLDNG